MGVFKKEYIKKYRIYVTGIVVVAALFFAVPMVSHAASLFFSPSSGQQSIGSSFSVTVFVSSTDQALNAISGSVSFPQDTLRVSNVSQANSIVNFWVQEPTFSNTAGTVSFEGVVTNPGFIGSFGRVVTITFVPRGSGTVSLNFSSASVLANDGLGTDILNSIGSAQFNIGGTAQQSEPTAAPTSVPLVTAGVPPAPAITSSTHPDQDSWYNQTTASFSWQVPDDVTSAQLLVGRVPQALPTVTYAPAISSRTITDLEDGVWYFHARLRNGSGFGPTTDYRFQIDTVAPEPFDITFPEGLETQNPRPPVRFSAVDETSGISYYQIKIGEGDFFSVTATDFNKETLYILPLQFPGKHNIVVRAYDGAENMQETAAFFTILPLEQPVIENYSRQIKRGEVFSVEGMSLPGVDVVIFLERREKEVVPYNTRADKNGKFSIDISNLLAGEYFIWAEAINDEGARSYSTEKLAAEVEGFNLAVAWDALIRWLVTLVPLIGVLTLLTLLGWFGWRKMLEVWKEIQTETRYLENNLRHSFDVLSDKAQKSLTILKKIKSRRALSKKEKNIEKHLDAIVGATEEIRGEIREDDNL